MNEAHKLTKKLNRWKRLGKKLGSSDCPVDKRLARQTRKQELESELRVAKLIK